MPAVHRERAPAKLTRSLRVTGRRADGYHLILSEMVALDIGDDLEITDLEIANPKIADPEIADPAAERDGASALEVVDAVSWTGSGTWSVEDRGHEDGDGVPPVPTGPDNLVLRALALAGRRARVRLVKRIPPGAGLGGGSADAAAILRWAGATDPELASRLGADVPFCVAGGRALVSGIGERIEPLAPDDATYLLVTPALSVSTARVYAAFDELGPPTGGDEVVNDLERSALAVEPRLALVRDVLAEATGLRPVLAGSGSTWYVPCGAGGTVLMDDVAAALAEARGRAAIALARTLGEFAP